MEMVPESKNNNLMRYVQPAAIVAGLLIVLFVGSYIAATVSETESIQTINVAEAVGTPAFYDVLTIFDGDTLLVSVEGKAEKVRLLGVDTPEVESPYTKEECFGPEASTFTRDLVLGSRVALVPDSQSADRDKFDRLLRYVVLENGVPLNEQLLDRGYARIYNGSSFDRKELFEQLESRAQGNERGLWKVCGSAIK